MSFRALLTQPLLREQSRLERRNVFVDARPRVDAAGKLDNPVWTAFLPTTENQVRSRDLTDAHREIFGLENAGYKVEDGTLDLDEGQDAPDPVLAGYERAEQVLRNAFGTPAESGPLHLGQSLQRIEAGEGLARKPLRSLSLLGG